MDRERLAAIPVGAGPGLAVDACRLSQSVAVQTGLFAFNLGGSDAGDTGSSTLDLDGSRSEIKSKCVGGSSSDVHGQRCEINLRADSRR